MPLGSEGVTEADASGVSGWPVSSDALSLMIVVVTVGVDSGRSGLTGVAVEAGCSMASSGVFVGLGVLVGFGTEAKLLASSVFKVGVCVACEVGLGVDVVTMG